MTIFKISKWLYWHANHIPQTSWNRSQLEQTKEKGQEEKERNCRLHLIREVRMVKNVHTKFLEKVKNSSKFLRDSYKINYHRNKHNESTAESTHILQLFCNSGTDKLGVAFWVKAWYFWAAAPSWLTWMIKKTKKDIKKKT